MGGKAQAEMGHVGGNGHQKGHGHASRWPQRCRNRQAACSGAGSTVTPTAGGLARSWMGPKAVSCSSAAAPSRASSRPARSVLASAARRCRRRGPPPPPAAGSAPAARRAAGRAAAARIRASASGTRQSGGGLRPVDPLARRQLQQFQAGPQQRGEVGRRQRVGCGLRLRRGQRPPARAAAAAPASRPGAAPRPGSARRCRSPRPRLGLGGFVGQLRQQQPGAQQGQPGRHDVPLGQPRQRHLPRRDRRIHRRGELLGQGDDGELGQVDPLRPGQLEQQVERALPGAERSTGAPALPTPARVARDAGARRCPASGIIVERPDLDPQRPASGRAAARRARQGVQSADQKPTQTRPGSRRRGWPRPGTGSSTHAAQRLGGAPVRPQPGQRLRAGRARAAAAGPGTGSSRCRSKRAGPARRGPLGHPALARLGGVAQLAGQDAAALQAEAAPLRRRRRHQQVEPVLRRRAEVVLPGDHAGARPPRPGRPRPQPGSPRDPEVVVEPVRVRQRQHLGRRPRSPPLPAPPGRHRASQVEQLDGAVGHQLRRGGHSRAWSSGRGGGCGPSPARRGRRPDRPRSRSRPAAHAATAAPSHAPSASPPWRGAAGCRAPRRRRAGRARWCPSGRPCGTPGRTAGRRPPARPRAPAPGRSPAACRG